jgi:hypothetical protein
MAAPDSSKTHLTAAEAATELGLTLDELRSLIRNHIADREDDLRNLPHATFQPSDLLLLRLLAAQPGSPTNPN